MALSRKTVRITARTMALSVPGTKPGWVEVGVVVQKSLPENSMSSQARLVYGQVVNEGSVSVRVMKTQRGLA